MLNPANFVQCQDCLAVVLLAHWSLADITFCECGGDLCGCCGCSHDASLLVAFNPSCVVEV